jgi:cytochrome c oxidase subunit IV
MSAATLAHAASHSPTESKFHIFVEVAMLLAVITGVEIIVIYLPLPQLLVLGVLAFIFMHLKWDRLFCTVMFFIGLTLATGTVTALYFLFAARDSKPVGSAYDAAALTAPASSARTA